MGQKKYILPKTATCTNLMSDEDRARIEQFYAAAPDAPEAAVPDHVIEDSVIPHEDWMLVRLDLPMEKTREGGVILPKSARPDPRVGLVVAVGPGTPVAPVRSDEGDLITHYPMSYSVGDIVMIDVPTCGRVIPGNERYKMFRQGNVCAGLLRNVFQDHGITRREDPRQAPARQLVTPRR